MARKRSTGGRRAKSSLASQIEIELNRANRRITGLRRSGDFGTYASKDILRLVSQNKYVSFDRRKRLKVAKTKDMNFAEARLISKRLKEFNKAKTATPSGIKEVKQSTKNKMKETLSGLTDQQISDQDVEFLYTLFNDKSTSNIFDYISPSELIIILNYCKQNNVSEQGFWDGLQQYIGETNQSDLKEQAIAIYRNYMQYGTL